MAHLMPPVGGANVDGTMQNITRYHKRNLNDWNFAEHFEPDVFAQVCSLIYMQFSEDFLLCRSLNKLCLYIHMWMFIIIDAIKVI
jgi:hypothetical protein